MPTARPASLQTADAPQQQPWLSRRHCSGRADGAARPALRQRTGPRAEPKACCVPADGLPRAAPASDATACTGSAAQATATTAPPQRQRAALHGGAGGRADAWILPRSRRQSAARRRPICRAVRDFVQGLVGGAAGAVPRGADAGTPAPIALPAPLHVTGFAQALGAQVSVLARDGVQQAELHLNPAEMGPITRAASAIDDTERARRLPRRRGGDARGDRTRPARARLGAARAGPHARGRRRVPAAARRRAARRRATRPAPRATRAASPRRTAQAPSRTIDDPRSPGRARRLRVRGCAHGETERRRCFPPLIAASPQRPCVSIISFMPQGTRAATRRRGVPPPAEGVAIHVCCRARRCRRRHRRCPPRARRS